MKLIMIAGLMLAANISACAAAPVGQGGGHALSDADLVRYQASAFDKRAMMFKHVRLGLHHGVAVVADFPCGDLCPEYTTRIIHYDVTPGPACAKAGGVEEPRTIPRGIAVTRQPFCVPGVLADKGR